MYEEVVTNGVKDENLTAVETHTQEINFDGTQTTFDLPVKDVKMNIYVNGLYLIEDIDYTIDRTVEPNTITFKDVYDPWDDGLIMWVVGKIETRELATKTDIDEFFPDSDEGGGDLDLG